MNDGIEWTKAPSKKGVPFEIGRRAIDITGSSPVHRPEDELERHGIEGPEVSSLQTPQVLEAERSAKSVLVEIKQHAIEVSGVISPPVSKGSSPIPVYWEVGDDVWHDTTGQLRGRGLTRYKLHKSSSPFFDYVLEFTTTQGWGWTFWDESGDGYDVKTINNGDHLYRYDSQNPTIIYVQ